MSSYHSGSKLLLKQMLPWLVLVGLATAASWHSEAPRDLEPTPVSAGAGGTAGDDGPSTPPPPAAPRREGPLTHETQRPAADGGAEAEPLDAAQSDGATPEDTRGPSS